MAADAFRPHRPAERRRESVLDGDIEFNKWPEQIYQIKSKIDIATQKEIFFKRDRFTATGQADFDGTFHYFKGGRELKGTWRTPVAHVKIGANTWRFPNLQGNVLWLPDRLEVTDATSGLYGGRRSSITASCRSTGSPGPKRAIWDVKYRDVQLAAADRLSRDRGDAAGRSGNRTQPPRMAARRMGPAARRRRVDASQPPPVSAAMTRELAPDAGGVARSRCRSRPGRSIRTRRSATCRSPATSPTRWIRMDPPRTRAGWRRRRPTSSSRGGPPT